MSVVTLVALVIFAGLLLYLFELQKRPPLFLVKFCLV